MELGARIKQARLEMGLSQRQLCGEEITRNMLSQIENGSARPSMATLTYLAQRLEKPVSYFLEEQAVVSPNQQVMARARQCFAEGNYRQVTDRLEEYRAPDDVFDQEKWLLQALSLMEQAKQAMAEGKTVYAQKLLESARQAGDSTAYFTPVLQREYTLLMAQAEPDRAVQWARQLPGDDRELLLRARVALEQQEYAMSARYLDAAARQDDQWCYLRGQAALGQKDYALAKTYFLKAEAQFPQPCAKALETCYRELEDYKMAYFYACKQRQM